VTAATVIEQLAEAFGKLNFALMGGWGGLFSDGKSPISQLMEDIQPLVDKADELAIVFGALEKLGNVDLSVQFGGMAEGMKEILAVIDGEKGVQITHTLENLALITTGTSAQMNAGNMMSSISSGIKKGFGGLFDKDMQVTLTLDKTMTNKLFTEGSARVTLGGSFFKGIA